MVLAAAALVLPEGALGVRTPALTRLLAFTALLPVGFDLARGIAWRSAARGFYGVLGLAFLLGSTRTSDAAGRAFILAAGALLLALASSERQTARAGTAATLGLGALLVAVGFLVRDRLSLWPLCIALARSSTRWFGGLSDHPTPLGPTDAGTWTLATLGALGLARWVLSSRRRVRPVALAIAAAGVLAVTTPVLVAAIQPALRPLDPQGLSAGRFILFALFLAPFVGFLWTHPPDLSPPPARGRPLVVGAAAGAFLAGTALLGFARLLEAHPVRVLLDTRGAFDLEPLAWGRYGRNAPQGASLATLPAVLAARGFRSTLHDTTLDGSLLSRHDVLLVMNPTRVHSRGEREAISRFVRQGGGLLVLGDHTDIQGIRDPVDSLLAPVRMRLCFDSAIPFAERWSWFGCMRRHPHPVTHGVIDETDVKTSVGASLEVPASARVLFSGRDAFADPGERRNARGAFLGNMRWDPGEPRGDLVLAAEMPLGRGKVIAFGDTSPFQRTSVSWTEPLVTRLITHLGTPGQAFVALRWRVLGVVLLAAGTFGLLWRAPPALGLAAGTALAAVAVLAVLDRRSRIDVGALPLQAQVAWIDVGHVNRVDAHAGVPVALGGLVNHLWRQGYLPLVTRELDAERLESAALAVIVAPARPYDAKEIGRLRSFVERGGLLLVSTGWEESAGAAALLGAFGTRIGPTPLGAAHQSKTHLPGQAIVMHEAWPVETQSGRAEIWAECWDRALVTFERVGKGGLIVIGDSFFLGEVGLESADAAVAPNIEFLRAALDSARVAIREGAP